MQYEHWIPLKGTGIPPNLVIKPEIPILSTVGEQVSGTSSSLYGGSNGISLKVPSETDIDKLPSFSGWLLFYVNSQLKLVLPHQFVERKFTVRETGKEIKRLFRVFRTLLGPSGKTDESENPAAAFVRVKILDKNLDQVASFMKKR
jgi:hypothetical protein